MAEYALTSYIYCKCGRYGRHAQTSDIGLRSECSGRFIDPKSCVLCREKKESTNG